MDAQGHADCQTGQTGYTDGPIAKSGSKYPPSNLDNPSDPTAFQNWEQTRGGGSHVAWDTDIPGLRGPSFVAQHLGIDSSSDVP